MGRPPLSASRDRETAPAAQAAADVLRRLRVARQRTERADREYQAALAARDRLVVAARDAGLTLQEIGDALGLLRQSVQTAERRARATQKTGSPSGS